MVKECQILLVWFCLFFAYYEISDIITGLTKHFYQSGTVLLAIALE